MAFLASLRKWSGTCVGHKHNSIIGIEVYKRYEEVSSDQWRQILAFEGLRRLNLMDEGCLVVC